MDKASFADVDSESKWWLLEPEVQDRLLEPRRDLSELLGFPRDDEWYLEKWKVEQLYDRLDLVDRTLVAEAEEAIDDHKRLAWLDKANALLRPKDDPAASADSPAEAVAAPAAAVTAAPAKKSTGLFAKKEPESPPAEAAGPEAAAPSDVVTIGATDALQTVLTDDSRIAQLASELQLSADEVRALLAELPEGFEQQVVEEAEAIAAETA